MPERIRLTGLIGNGVLCLAFGVLALASLGEDQPGMVIFFALIAAAAGFNWYVIRKSARLLAEEASLQAQLRQQLAHLQATAGATTTPPRQSEGPPP